MLLVGQHGEETRPDVIVVAHVLVLLLTPDQLCVGILFCLGSDQVKWERGDLRRGNEECETEENHKWELLFSQCVKGNLYLFESDDGNVLL